MRPRNRSITGAFALVTSITLLCGCGGGSSSDPDSDGDVTLTIQTFGKFGYDDLFAEYEKNHPGVTVKSQAVATSSDASDAINTHLASGNGMPDVVAVEGNSLAAMMQYPDKWLPVDDSLKDRWLTWKSASATDADGVVRFYGVDAGPTAVCFNSTLLQAAGLPADPESFASWIGTSWDSYYAAGQEYTSKTGKPWFDSASAVLEAKLAQIPNAFEESDDTVIATTNAEVEDAYTDALMDNTTLSAHLDPFSSDWNTGVQQSTFATTVCPSWEIGLIEAAAPNATGWNVANTFPDGGANRGGSYLGVSTQTEHPDQAKDLAAWLTAPEQEIKAFAAVGSFPSQVEALSSPTLLSSTSEFASGAPVGQIYSDLAKAITAAPYKGPQYNTINTYLLSAVTRVETGTMDADTSWKQFVSDVENNTK